jgi:hypothetical protein
MTEIFTTEIVVKEGFRISISIAPIRYHPFRFRLPSVKQRTPVSSLGPIPPGGDWGPPGAKFSGDMCYDGVTQDPRGSASRILMVSLPA